MLTVVVVQGLENEKLYLIIPDKAVVLTKLFDRLSHQKKRHGNIFRAHCKHLSILIFHVSFPLALFLARFLLHAYRF